jgi:hypothetical protein
MRARIGEVVFFSPFFFVSPQPGVSNVLLIIIIVLYILPLLLARPLAFQVPGASCKIEQRHLKII